MKNCFKLTAGDDFNSQPHEEADCRGTETSESKGISTHSLTKRLTFVKCFINWIFNISTHSLTKRLTRTEDLPPELEKYFNSQPHEEANKVTLHCDILLRHFNSQPHEEADSRELFYLSVFFYFNSQPHEEADEQRSALTI